MWRCGCRRSTTPAYKDKTFPVVELLPGYPGSSRAWFGTLKSQEQLTPLMERGEVDAVHPRLAAHHAPERQGHRLRQCRGIVNADTWLSVDVRKMVTDNFRADTGADGWAVAGYSAGAHCAAKLAVEHPDRYRAGVDLSGYNDPAAEKDSITAKDPKLREESNPLWILKHAANPAARLAVRLRRAERRLQRRPRPEEGGQGTHRR